MIIMWVWERVDEYVFEDPLYGVTRILHPNYTECCGKRFYIDRTLYLSTGESRPVRSKKNIIDWIITDGRFLIAPDYWLGTNIVIDVEKGSHKWERIAHPPGIHNDPRLSRIIAEGYCKVLWWEEFCH